MVLSDTSSWCLNHGKDQDFRCQLTRQADLSHKINSYDLIFLALNQHICVLITIKEYLWRETSLI